MIASVSVLRGLARASFMLFLSRPASAMLPAEISVTRGGGAADCPSGRALTERVERIQNATVPAPDRGEGADAVTVHVDFARAADEYSAHLSFRGAKRGERRLVDSGASCEGLAEAVSLAIALALDRNEEQAEAVDSSASAAKPEPVPSPRTLARVNSTDTSREETPKRSLGFGAMLESGAGFAFGSALAWSVAGRAQIFYRGFSFEGGAHAVLPRTTDAGTGSVRTSWLFAEAAICRSWGERFTFGPCAAFGFGRVHGAGAGYDAVREADLAWLAAAGGIVLSGPVAGPLQWGLSGTLWVPLRKLTFSVENGGVVWESSAISGVIAAGVGVRFR